MLLLACMNLFECRVVVALWFVFCFCCFGFVVLFNSVYFIVAFVRLVVVLV